VAPRREPECPSYSSPASWSSEANRQTPPPWRLDWRWIDGARTLAHGQLTWPVSFRAEEAHADRLLEIVEAGLAPGCPPAMPPAKAADGMSGDAHSIDASPAAQAAIFETLRREFQNAAAACPAPGGDR
jgi:hypothetical protein